MAAIEAKGVRLELRHGLAHPQYPGSRVVPDVAEVIERAGRLLAGYLAERDGTGAALRCELHEDGEDVPEAVTLASGSGLGVCARCMGWER